MISFLFFWLVICAFLVLSVLAAATLLLGRGQGESERESAKRAKETEPR